MNGNSEAIFSFKFYNLSKSMRTDLFQNMSLIHLFLNSIKDL